MKVSEVLGFLRLLGEETLLVAGVIENKGLESFAITLIKLIQIERC